MANESERLIASFSKGIFYKEILYSDLYYIPEGETSEIELADLIIYLGDILLAIQLKERNPGDNSGDIIVEKKWLAKKGKKAKEQVKDTIDQIRSGRVKELVNQSGQKISIRKDVEIIPLVVFKNETIDEYDHILRKHNDTGLDVNCISIWDYEEICKMLISPIEILNYLKWRKYVYADSPTIDTSIYFDEKENISITNFRNKEGLPLQFLHQKYGMDVVKQDNNYLRMFSEYLNVLSEHVVSESEKNSYYQMILFLAHLDRIEIGAFVERIKIAADCNNKGEKTICGSIRNINQNRVIFFSSAREFCDTDFLISLVRKNGMEPKYLLQVIVYYECKQEYRIDMKLWSAN